MTTLQETSILIVDDSSFSRNLISKMLQEEHIVHLFEAHDARSALEIIREKKPKVMITDVVMPEMSGIELTKIVSEKFPEISSIVISSLSQDHIILEAIAAGASDFISKPIDKTQLIDSLEKVITIEN